MTRGWAVSDFLMRASKFCHRVTNVKTPTGTRKYPVLMRCVKLRCTHTREYGSEVRFEQRGVVLIAQFTGEAAN